MSTNADALNEAIRCHQAGELPRAEQLYRQILAAEPAQADALHLLGLVALQSGRAQEGISLVRDSLRINPQQADVHSNLAIALDQQGDVAGAVASWREAVRCRPGDAELLCRMAGALKKQGNVAAAAAGYSQALLLQPDHSEALNSLANLLQQQGDLKSAVPLYQRLLRLAPDHLGALNNLSYTLIALGRAQEALPLLQHAIQLKPDYASAHNNLGNALLESGRPAEALASYRRVLEIDPKFVPAYNNLGKIHLDEGRLDEAAGALLTAVRLQPDFIEAHNTLGSVLLEQRKFDEAAARFRIVLQLNPRHAAAHGNLGNVFAQQDRLDDAVAEFQEALRLQPNFAETYNNLGLARQEQGHVDEAIATLQRAIELKANHAEAHKNLGIALLLRGDFARGWVEYEWRRQADRQTVPDFPQPEWRGEALGGRTILLHTEQGFGDTLQFVRYAPLVQQRGGRVVLACQRRLLPLVSRARGIDVLLPSDEALLPFDTYAPLMSLPRIFGTTLASVPAQVPYLGTDPQRVQRWRNLLPQRLQPQASSLKPLQIGVAWQGNTAYRRDRQRSIALAHFAPLAAVPGVQLISLQKGPAAGQISAVSGQFTVAELGDDFDESGGAFEDTAAVMQNLDLVITSDTVVAHLAGALGVRVWVALAYAPDWRWLLEREDCPWYPSMRLFRQSARRAWPEVFQRMAGELCRLQNGAETAG